MAAPVPTQCVKYTTGSGNGGTVNSFMTFVAGRLGVVGTGTWSSGLLSSLTFSDSVDGAWTAAHTGAKQENSNARMFYRANLTGGLVNMTWGSPENGVTLFCHEASGAATTSPMIAAAIGVVNGGTTLDSTNVDNGADADALYFAVMTADLGANPATININQTGTEGTWNEYNASARETNGSAVQTGSMVNQGVTSGSSRGHVWTMGATCDAAAVIAAFKAAAGGAADQVPFTRARLWQPLLAERQGGI